MKIWVITEEHNLHDQHGGYFIAAYTTKAKALASVDHVGRLDYEDVWYELDEVEVDAPCET